MRTPAEVIASAIRYDHLPGSGAQSILDALRDEGYVIVARGSGSRTGERLPETTAMFTAHPMPVRRSPMVGELRG